MKFNIAESNISDMIQKGNQRNYFTYLVYTVAVAAKFLLEFTFSQQSIFDTAFLVFLAQIPRFFEGPLVHTYLHNSIMM